MSLYSVSFMVWRQLPFKKKVIAYHAVLEAVTEEEAFDLCLKQSTKDNPDFKHESGKYSVIKIPEEGAIE